MDSELTTAAFTKMLAGALRFREESVLFIYKALLDQLPGYLTSLLSYNLCNYSTQTHDSFVFKYPVCEDI